MNGAGGILILTSAFFHAAWNAVVKWEGDAQRAAKGVFFAATVFAAAALVFVPRPFVPSWEPALWAIASGICEAGYILTLALALKASDLGPAYAVMRGGAMIIVWFLSAVFLAEPFTVYSVAGAFLILAGLSLIHEPRGFIQALLKMKWAYLSAVFIAGYHIFYGRALHAEMKPVPCFALSCSVAVPFLILLGGRDETILVAKKFAARPLLLLGGGALSTLSFLLFLAGLQTAGAGLAISLRNTSVAWAQVFSVLIGERPVPRQWFAAVLITVGAAVLMK